MRLLSMTSDRDFGGRIAASFGNRATCHIESSAGEAIALATRDEFDAMVIDSAMPRAPHLDIIRRIRAEGIATPILLMLEVNSPATRIEAFTVGADDVMSRGFVEAELVVRVNTLVRRCNGHSQPTVKLGSVTIDFNQRCVFVNGVSAELTAKEFDVVELLALRRGKVLSKENFLNYLYGGLNEPEVKIIDVFICKLRKKLASLGASDLITTVRGKGYVLRDAPPAQPAAPPVNTPAARPTFGIGRSVAYQW